jgi:hypothetical protein
MVSSMAASKTVPSTAEATPSPVIVRNFNKGLMLLRSAPLPPVVPPVPRRQIHPPKLCLLPSATPPRNGILFSVLVHSGVIPMLLVLPIAGPTRAFTAADNYRDYDHPLNIQPIFLPLLPKTAGADLRAVGNRGAAATTESAEVRLKPDYAGPQEIVSNPPNAIKGVQTIRRPDLINPPNLSFPLRLPSQVVLPARAIPLPSSPRLAHPLAPPTKQRSASRAEEPLIQNQVLAVDTLGLSVVPAAPQSPTTTNSDPKLSAGSGTTGGDVARKSVVVVDALSVPPDVASAIPDAQLASEFFVGPRTDTATPSPALRSDQNDAGRSAGRENLSHLNAKNGAGRGTEHSNEPPRTNAGAGSADSARNVAVRTESHGDSLTAAPSKSLQDITISGGILGRDGRAPATSSPSGASYGITIISGGNSGGASRDLGVFARTDTVYTVYIPMSDTGGGSDWSMQYASMSSARSVSSNALLTPPVVLKKVLAAVPRSSLYTSPNPVFVTGTIEENGKIQALRALRGMDAKAQAAVTSLSQWKFQAAQLEGKPVPCRILIGVNVVAIEEVGNQQP